MNKRWSSVLGRLSLAASVCFAAQGCYQGPDVESTSQAVRSSEVHRGPGSVHRGPGSVHRGPVSVEHGRSRPQTLVSTTSSRSSARVAPSLTLPPRSARILVISADGSEAALPAIRQALDYLGTPYTVRIATTAGPLTANQLSVDGRGNYQGVILTTASLAFYDGSGWRSALSPDEWQVLWNYEATYAVRQVSWYTYPTPELGFAWGTSVDTSAVALEVKVTDAGRQVFPYVTPNARVAVRDAYTYLSVAADPTATPLLTDDEGHALALVNRYPDGRENLALTFDSSPHQVHALVFSYGVIDWVTRGLFLGARHTYLSAQVDDIFLGNDLYTGGEYRMTGDDLRAAVAWQRALQARPASAGLRLDMVYNGEGTVAGEYPSDTLTPAASSLQGEFKWINHTYSHLNLDAVDYATAFDQYRDNIQVAQRMRFSAFTRTNLVTGEVSGLFNPAAMQAAADVGVRYVVSDTSRPGQDNPSPNAGIYNALAPSILMIPRRPTNLFYNVSTPEQWVAEYNDFYRVFWGRDLSYSEILDRETDVLLRYMLRGEIDPWMFHQSNLRAYDGSHTLLGDLIARLLERYNALVTLPVVSPTMDETGRQVASRMRFNASGVTATIVPGQSITLTAPRAAVVPVTGLASRGAESYAGETISYVNLSAGASVTLRLE